MRLLIMVAAMALVASGCDWMERKDAPPRVDAAKARLQQVRQACASKLTYARLKEYVFDEAARIRNSDPRRLDSLAAYSVVRMEEPVVKSRDDDLNIIVCSGRFVLDLPPGIQDAFDGQTSIKADVEYAAQGAVDGSGLVYSMSGAEPIIYRLAAVGLSARPLPQIAATQSDAIDRPAAPVVAPDAPPRPAVAPPRPTPPPRVVAPPPKKPEPQLAARPQPRPSLESDRGARPSFNCGYAKTRSEKMVCRSGALAAADRRMSAAYYSQMAGAPPGAKRALRRTRDT